MIKTQNIQEKTKKISAIDDVRYNNLIGINFAFQNTINWGGNNFMLKEKDLIEIKDLIEQDDLEKTGSQIWKWFYHKWDKKFITGLTMEYIGSEFMRNLDRYHE